MKYENVEHARTKHLESVLLSRGVDHDNLLRSNVEFNLTDSLVKIESDIPNVIKRAVTVKKQYDVACRILDNPLKTNYILGIGSFPTDLRAKQMAVMVMRNAILTINKRKLKGDYPLWHKIYGNYKDSLRDSEDIKPSLLVISNVTSDSTQLKIEKTRDLLEKYSNIPRIVVVGGTDPISFFANKLYLPVTACLYFGPDNRVRQSI